MPMIKRWFMLVCLLWLAASRLAVALAYAPPPSPSVKYNFNAAWRVHVGDVAGAAATGFDDAAWKHVTTPYAWNEDSAFKVSIEQLPTGIAWYRSGLSCLPMVRVKKSSLNLKVFGTRASSISMALGLGGMRTASWPLASTLRTS